MNKMATRLTIKAESHYKDIDVTSTREDTVMVEPYAEGDDDTISRQLEAMVKFLLGCGYSLGLICKYLNTDGAEVWEIGEE